MINEQTSQVPFLTLPFKTKIIGGGVTVGPNYSREREGRIGGNGYEEG